MARTRHVGRPTLQEVADRAGVSIATASRALTGRGQVAPATMRAVTEVADHLGYEMAAARTQRLDRRLAVVVGSTAALFMGEVMAGVNEVGGDGPGGCVVVSTGDDPVREIVQLRSLLDDRDIAGVVVAGGRWTSTDYLDDLQVLVDDYRGAGRPLVFCGRPALPSGGPDLVVDYDNVGGARAAMAHLLGNGHREILVVRGPEGFTTSDGRAEGARLAAADFSMTLDPRLVRVGSRDRRAGHRAVQDALRDGVMFTAVLADCDVMAAGVLAALTEAGRSVPGDVSVVGMDNINLAADLRVPLTTVHVPFHDVGHTAARMALEPERFDRDTQLVAGTHLVIRQSVQPRHG